MCHDQDRLEKSHVRKTKQNRKGRKRINIGSETKGTEDINIFGDCGPFSSDFEKVQELVTQASPQFGRVDAI